MSMSDIDIQIFRIVHDQMHSDMLNQVAPILRNKLTWVPLYLVILGYLYQRFSHRIIWILIGSAITIALVDGLCANILKELFERIRPCVAHAGEAWLHDFGLCSMRTYSMPSCHAMNHAALAAFIYPFFRRSLRYAFILWVALIGWAQVYVGVHYPSDIIVGAASGWLIGRSSFFLYQSVLKKFGLV